MSKQPNQRQRERAFRSSMRRLVSPDAHRWAMPVIALVMLIGIIAGAIWVSSITRQHVHLDDGTVWVTSLKNRKAARFNVKLKEPDSAVASSAARFDIVQHDSDTVLTEGAKATGISSATLGTTGRTETKGDTTAVTGGGTIAFLNTKNGNVWVGRSSDLNSVNPATSDPSMRLGTGGKIAVTHDGTVYGYRPSDGTVLTMQDPTGKAVQGGSLTEGKTVSADDFTVVDGTAVVHIRGQTVLAQGQRRQRRQQPVDAAVPRHGRPSGVLGRGRRQERPVPGRTGQGREESQHAHLRRCRRRSQTGLHRRLRVVRVGAKREQLRACMLAERQQPGIWLAAIGQRHVGFGVPHQPPPDRTQRRGRRQRVEPFGLHQGHQDTVEHHPDRADRPAEAERPVRQQPAQLQQDLFRAIRADQGAGRRDRRPRGRTTDPRRAAQRRADRLLRAADHQSRGPGGRRYDRIAGVRRPVPAAGRLGGLGRHGDVHL